MTNTVPIEVRVRSGFLVTSDIRRFPTEQEIKALVDDVGEQRRVDDIAPHRCRRKDSFTTENKVHEGGAVTPMSQVPRKWRICNVRCLHQTINDRGGQTGGAHCRSQCDKYVYSLVELRMNGEGRKRLSGTLAEADVANILRLGDVEDVINGIRDVVPCKVVNRIVPKLFRVRVIFHALFRIFVASVIPQPNVKPKVDQNKGESAIR